MLSKTENHRLDEAEGKWPTLARTILELSEKHEVLPPKFGFTGPTHYQELPKSAEGHFFPKHHMDLKQYEGRWPDYALEATKVMRQSKSGRPVPALGASKPAEFPPATEAFIKDEMYRNLPSTVVDGLKNTEGHWPDYPRALHKAARDYNLVIPFMTLPGPRELWDAARLATPASNLPDVPDLTLRRFALLDLTAAERAEMKLSVTDLTSRDRLRQEYFKRNPDELRRRRPEKP
jgi:hypothetical protein